MKPRWAQAVRALATVAALAAWAIASHIGSAGFGGADFGTAVAVAPLALAWAVLVWQTENRWVRLAGVMAAGVLVLSLWPQLRANAVLLYYLEHVGALLALAVVFGKSLWAPDGALITSMARLLDGNTLSEQKARYTRQVTMAWTIFFVVNALVSTGLFLVASPRIWSVHAHLLMGPWIALMFLGELLVRRRVLPRHEHPSVADVVRAYRELTARSAAADPDPEPGR